MTDVMEEITRWAAHGNLPFWEQAALNHILAGDPLTDGVVEHLVDYLLEDAGLEPKTSARPALTHLAASEAHGQDGAKKYHLTKIHNLKNINALVPNQKLEFGSNLTVIFGSNGSGKSGYARVIGSAAFTRGDFEIFRNVSASSGSRDPLSAEIELASPDGETVAIHYVIGESCPQLRSFYVFDSTSVKNHLTKENPMSFSPAGLETLTTLTNLTDRVRKALEARCACKDCSKNIYDPLFAGETKVKAYIRNLGAEADLKALEKLAAVTEEDKTTLAQLELTTAQIRSQRISETISQLSQEIKDLVSLRESMGAVEKWLQSEQFTQANPLILSHNQSEQLARASRSISNIPRTAQQDPPVWEDFIRAAYRLGQMESQIYPAEGDRCLLCGQPVSADGRDLIHRIWQSIHNEAETNRNAIWNKLRDLSAVVQSFKFELLDPQTAAFRCIQKRDPETLQVLQKNSVEIKRVCDNYQTAIQTRQPTHVDLLPVVRSDLVQRVLDQVTAEHQSLIDQNTGQRLQQLEKQKLELQHRVLLATQIKSIREFVENARWVKLASSSSVKRNSKHITLKANELFDQLVTQRYIQLFEENLIKLNCPLRVRIDTRGKKGETRKQIALVRDNNESITEAAPDKILSEGEQRAVALADFLTEVALNVNSSGILLDDPVTSLDFQWKETIAKHIVEEASRQQVILFTHDLHFLYLIKKYAEDQKVNIAGHWIQKRNDLPGWVFLNNSPVSEKDFKRASIAENYAKRPNLRLR